MTVKENRKILSRATIRALTITALVAVAAVFSTQNTGVAFGECLYQPNSGDQADLWLDMGSEDTYFTDAEWPNATVKTFSLDGPFRGDVNIWTYEDWGLTTSTTSSDITCTTAQWYTVNKNAESMPIYLKRCNWGETANLQFGITHERKCILNGTQSNIYPLLITESDMEGTFLTYSTGGEDGTGNQNDEDTTDTTTTTETDPPPERENLVIDVNAPGCTATGTLKSSLAVTGLNGQEIGPTKLDMWWNRTPEAYNYCIRIKHANPASVPAGVGEFPEQGWAVSISTSWRHMNTHGAEIGGDDFSGFYAGGSFVVTVQGIDIDGNYGPADTHTMETHHSAELGAVRNLRAFERSYSETGQVSLQWDAAPGQPQHMQWHDSDSYILEWREDGQQYSPERTKYSSQGSGNFFFKPPFGMSTPVLTPDTNYHFRVTPRRINMPDGDPAEVFYRTRALGPATITIGKVDVTGKVWMTVYVATDRSIQQMLISVRWENGQVMEYTTEGGGWSWLERISMPPPGEICVKVLGVVGAGEDAVTGQWSDETCVVRQLDTTTSVGRFQQTATRAAEQLKKAGILPGQGATKVKTGPAWPALYFGAVRVAEVVQENEVPLISTTK